MAIIIETYANAAANAAVMGLTGLAADLFIKAAAPRRHHSRVLATLAASFSEVGLAGPEALAEVIGEGRYPDAVWPARNPETPETMLRAGLAQAWSLIILDLHGTGGPMGVMGGATERHPGFGRLGTGRWNARDGGAWRAAAEEAAALIIRALPPDYLTGDASGSPLHRPGLFIAPYLPEGRVAWTAVRTAGGLVEMPESCAGWCAAFSGDVLRCLSTGVPLPAGADPDAPPAEWGAVFNSAREAELEPESSEE